MAETADSALPGQQEAAGAYTAVVQFCRMFGSLLRIRPFSADILERALLDPSEHRMFLSELLCKLLRPDTSAPFSERDCDAWEDLLHKKFRASWRASFVEANPLADTGFYAISPLLRSQVLYALCDWRVHDCPIVSQALRQTAESSEQPEGSLRHTAIGEDSRGGQYFYFSLAFEDCRLYRQQPPIRSKPKSHKKQKPADLAEAATAAELGEADWETAATSVEEIEGVADSFSNSRNRAEKSLSATLVRDILPKLRETVAARRRAEERAAAIEAMPRKRSSRIQVLNLKKEEEDKRKLEMEVEMLQHEFDRRHGDGLRPMEDGNPKQSGSGSKPDGPLSREERLQRRLQIAQLAKEAEVSEATHPAHPAHSAGDSQAGPAPAQSHSHPSAAVDGRYTGPSDGRVTPHSAMGGPQRVGTHPHLQELPDGDGLLLQQQAGSKGGLKRGHPLDGGYPLQPAAAAAAASGSGSADGWPPSAQHIPKRHRNQRTRKTSRLGSITATIRSFAQGPPRPATPSDSPSESQSQDMWEARAHKRQRGPPTHRSRVPPSRPNRVVGSRAPTQMGGHPPPIRTHSRPTDFRDDPLARLDSPLGFAGIDGLGPEDGLGGIFGPDMMGGASPLGGPLGGDPFDLLSRDDRFGGPMSGAVGGRGRSGWDPSAPADPQHLQRLRLQQQQQQLMGGPAFLDVDPASFNDHLPDASPIQLHMQQRQHQAAQQQATEQHKRHRILSIARSNPQLLEVLKQRHAHLQQQQQQRQQQMQQQGSQGGMQHASSDGSRPLSPEVHMHGSGSSSNPLAHQGRPSTQDRMPPDAAYPPPLGPVQSGQGSDQGGAGLSRGGSEVEPGSLPLQGRSTSGLGPSQSGAAAASASGGPSPDLQARQRMMSALVARLSREQRQALSEMTPQQQLLMLQRLQQQTIQAARLQAQRQAGLPQQHPEQQQQQAQQPQPQQQQPVLPRSPMPATSLQPIQTRPGSGQGQSQAVVHPQRNLTGAPETQVQRPGSGPVTGLQQQPQPQAQVLAGQPRPGSAQLPMQPQSHPLGSHLGSPFVGGQHMTPGPQPGLQQRTSFPSNQSRSTPFDSQQRAPDQKSQAQQGRPLSSLQVSGSGQSLPGIASPGVLSGHDSTPQPQQSLSSLARRISGQSMGQSLQDRQESAGGQSAASEQNLQQQQQKMHTLLRLQQQVLHCMTPQQRQNYSALGKEDQSRTMAVLVGKLQQSIIRRQQMQQPSARSPNSQLATPGPSGSVPPPSSGMMMSGTSQQTTPSPSPHPSIQQLQAQQQQQQQSLMGRTPQQGLQQNAWRPGMSFPNIGMQPSSQQPVGTQLGALQQPPFGVGSRNTPSSMPLSAGYQHSHSGDKQRVMPGIPSSQPQQWSTPAGWPAGQLPTPGTPTPGSLQQLQGGMPRPTLQQQNQQQPAAGLQAPPAASSAGLPSGSLQSMLNGAGQAPSFLQNRSTSLSSQQQLLHQQQQQQLSQQLPEQPRQFAPGALPQASAPLSAAPAPPTSSQPPGQQRSAAVQGTSALASTPTPVQATSGLPASNPLGSMPMRTGGAAVGVAQPRPYGQQLPQQLAKPGGLAPAALGGNGGMPFTAGMPMGFVSPQQAQAWSALQMQLHAMHPSGQGSTPVSGTSALTAQMGRPATQPSVPGAFQSVNILGGPPIFASTPTQLLQAQAAQLRQQGQPTAGRNPIPALQQPASAAATQAPAPPASRPAVGLQQSLQFSAAQSNPQPTPPATAAAPPPAGSQPPPTAASKPSADSPVATAAPPAMPTSASPAVEGPAPPPAPGNPFEGVPGMSMSSLQQPAAAPSPFAAAAGTASQPPQQSQAITEAASQAPASVAQPSRAPGNDLHEPDLQAGLILGLPPDLPKHTGPMTNAPFPAPQAPSPFQPAGAQTLPQTDMNEPGTEATAPSAPARTVSPNEPPANAS
ncbi:hypothetical protein WJX74_002411 [Apatococcus lobatus]|uniref:DDT domain-containing protein n=1 Tax=Apatococcus lobatus TaxID=904363 RepID=A0AAW1RGL7_9CHLO